MSSPIGRSLALLTVAVAVVAGGCSSSTADTTTTTATTVATPNLGNQMCHTLELLEAAGVTGPAAAVALEAVDLADADSQVRSEYGQLLVNAPRSHCAELTDYADDVAYWLGY